MPFSVVDSALEVVDEYHSKIMKMEHDILLKPKMKTVRFRKSFCLTEH